jgi:hypothetical protein
MPSPGIRKTSPSDLTAAGMRKNADRHKARRAFIKAHGEAAAKGKDIDHITPLSKGGSVTALSNLRAITPGNNRSYARKGHKVK